MDLPALERMINALERSLDSLGCWLAFFTFLVVVGLIVEYAEDVKELVTKRPFDWKLFRTLIGGVLITAGVAGELFIQFRASKVETELRSANHRVQAQLSSDAASAKAEAAQAKKDTETERLARVKIEERVAWRRLTKEQQSKIASRLSRFSGQPALVQYNVDDVEADTFGLDMAAALQLAKWKVSEPLAVLRMREGPVPLGTNPPLPRGVTVISTGDQAARKASEAVIHELSKLGFDATKSLQADPRTSSAVFILVEHRPEGAQGEAKLTQQQR